MARRSPIAAALVLALAGAAPAADPKEDEAVIRAIKGGQAYLKAFYQPGGRGGLGPGGFAPPPPLGVIAPAMDNGAGALAGLALVESGVPADDPVVAHLARQIREAALGASSTYGISLYIMFLDRLGSKDDEPLVQFLTLRLLTGQCADGSWSYQCAGLPLDPVEQRALYADLMRGAKVATPGALPKPKKKEARPREDLDDKPRPDTKGEPPAPKEEAQPKGLHPALEKYQRRVKELPPGAGAGIGYGLAVGGDHSNTQFATVGLWCGRRHHVDVSAALTALDKHYRQSQGEDGGWTYSTTAGASSPAMACAGLMGLAMGFAKDTKEGSVRLDPDAVAKDRVLERGLKYVGDFLSAAGGQRDPRSGLFEANGLSGNLYFMWSLERVGMVYGLTTIGKVDWYDWGSKVLVRTQNRDGSWSTNSHGTVDNATAFALLFLCRANLAEDLATSMKGKVKDPGTSRLRSPADLNEMLGKAGKGSTGPKADPGTSPAKDPGAPTPKADLPAAAPSAGKLADALIAADGAERGALVAKYRDTRGVEYTDALARAIPKLTGEARAQARDALAKRAGRFTPNTLNAMMAERDPELRRAAALAAGDKGRDRLADLAESLVRLTADDDPQVAQAARASLKALSGEDFGPEPGASTADRTRALTAWQNWWTKQKSK